MQIMVRRHAHKHIVPRVFGSNIADRDETAGIGQLRHRVLGAVTLERKLYRPDKAKYVDKIALDMARDNYFRLCESYLKDHRDDEYADYIKSSIANYGSLDRHIRALELYAPYIEERMKILDWGCRHAPDSCMLRTVYPTLDIHGCDLLSENFAEFHEYAGLSFRALEHEYVLPYEDNSFDVVVSSGVLEHVAFEQKSIDQIWRVLKQDGLFIITFLPNRFSITENASRVLKTYRGHNRLYDLGDAKNTFLRCGFVVVSCGYHQVFPTFSKGVNGSAFLNSISAAGARMNRVFERIPGVNRVSANLYFVLRRVTQM